MNEGRLKVLVGILALAVVVLLLDGFGLVPILPETEGETRVSAGGDGIDDPPGPPFELRDPIPPSELGLAEITTRPPKTPAGEHLEWMIRHMDSGATEMTEQEVIDRIAASRLEEMSAAEVIASLQDAAKTRAPLSLIGFLTPPTEHRVEAIVAGPNWRYQIFRVETEEQPPHRARVLYIEPEDYDPEGSG